MKIIAAIVDPQVIKKILTHLGLAVQPPMPWSARGPPQNALDDFQQLPMLGALAKTPYCSTYPRCVDLNSLRSLSIR